jgi:hypothetical protein
VFSDLKIVCDYFQERRENYRRSFIFPFRVRGIKKTHPTNQMSFEYVEQEISKLVSDLSISDVIVRAGIGTFSLV